MDTYTQNMTAGDFIAWLLMKLPGAEGEDFERLHASFEKVTNDLEHLEKCWKLEYKP